MTDLIKEIGRTVRWALESNSRTVRLGVILLFAAIAYVFIIHI